MKNRRNAVQAARALPRFIPLFQGMPEHRRSPSPTGGPSAASPGAAAGRNTVRSQAPIRQSARQNAGRSPSLPRPACPRAVSRSASSNPPAAELFPQSGLGVVAGVQEAQCRRGRPAPESMVQDVSLITNFSISSCSGSAAGSSSLLSKPSQDASEVPEMPETLRAKSSGLELCRRLRRR